LLEGIRKPLATFCNLLEEVCKLLATLRNRPETFRDLLPRPRRAPPCLRWHLRHRAHQLCVCGEGVHAGGSPRESV